MRRFPQAWASDWPSATYTDVQHRCDGNSVRTFRSAGAPRPGTPLSRPADASAHSVGAPTRRSNAPERVIESSGISIECAPNGVPPLPAQMMPKPLKQSPQSPSGFSSYERNNVKTSSKQRPQRELNHNSLRRQSSPIDARSSEKQASSQDSDVVNLTTDLDASKRPKLQPTNAPTDEDLEAAIVAAMLDGRGAVAELLAERLRERRHLRAGVVEIVGNRPSRH